MARKIKAEIRDIKHFLDIAEMLCIVKISSVDPERGVGASMHERFADYLDKRKGGVPTSIKLNTDSLSAIISDYISENPDLENRLCESINEKSFSIDDVVSMTACVGRVLRLLEREYTLENSEDLI